MFIKMSLDLGKTRIYEVRHWLNNNYPKKRIGKRGSIEQPPTLPDLSLSIFLWGYLKLTYI